jgi:hypothetical protein
MKHKSHREKTKSLLDANKVSIEIKADEENNYILCNKIQGKITT